MSKIKIKVEVEKVETNSGTLYSVHVIEKDAVTPKAHCSSFAEADRIAQAEAERLQVRVSYGAKAAADARPGVPSQRR